MARSRTNLTPARNSKRAGRRGCAPPCLNRGRDRTPRAPRLLSGSVFQFSNSAAQQISSPTMFPSPLWGVGERCFHTTQIILAMHLHPSFATNGTNCFCLRIKGGEAPKGASSLEPRHTSKRRRLNVNRRQVYAVCVTYLLTRQRAYRSPLAFRRSAAAWEAMHVLLKRSSAPPPVYRGQFDPKAR